MQIDDDGAQLNRATTALPKKPAGHAKTDLAYWRKRLFKQSRSPNWYVELSARGQRRKLSLETPNKETAAGRARDIYQLAKFTGWPAALSKYRPQTTEPKSDLTLGEYITLAESVAGVGPITLRSYASALRKIVADVCGIDMGLKKFVSHGSGHHDWLSRVHAVKLASLTPQKIQAWKRTHLSRTGQDPVSQRSAKTTVNSYLRSARSLFSKRILKHLGDIVLPDPLPFLSVEFEPRQSLKYRSVFDVQALIIKAQDELTHQDPEAFKAFLLAVLAGLRRKEIDLLEWDSFLWESGVIRVQATRYFNAKTEDSLGDVAVDTQLLERFRGYRARATGSFVIESDGQPRSGTNYHYYRCQEVFERLSAWLRQNGVNTNRPLHTLRKEFGSQVCAIHGIHAASRQLRHTVIATTDLFYTDGRKRALTGLGHLLKSDDRVVLLSQDQSGPSRTGDSPALGGG